jgi:Flp pilus assembly protein TadG
MSWATRAWRGARRLLRARAGVTTLEFGLIAVPMLMLAMGIIEYGRLIWTNQVLEDAAAAGARCMGVLATGCTSGGAYSASATSTYLQQQLNDAEVAISSATVNLSTSTTCGGVGGFSQVTIAYTFHTVLPLLLTPLANGIPLTAQACFPNQS